MSSTLRKMAMAGVALGVIGASVADAAPVRITAPSAVGFGGGSGGVSADTVQYRRYYGGRYYGRGYGRRGYGAGGAIAAGAALGLLGAGIAAAAAPSYGYGYGGYPAYSYGGYPAYGYGGGYPGYGYYGY